DREPWRERARRWIKRHRTFATAAGSTLVLSVVSLTAIAILLTAATERERAAKNQAEIARGESDASRARAQQNFLSAREAVDLMLARVGDERLRNVPKMEQLRLDLLN